MAKMEMMLYAWPALSTSTLAILLATEHHHNLGHQACTISTLASTISTSIGQLTISNLASYHGMYAYQDGDASPSW